ncbi:MAG: DUF6088 family protein [Pseudomonadota bacterium]|jgi:hypothetical protein
MRGPALDLKPKIRDRIAGRPAAVWTPADFLDLGARAAVDKALQRLATGGDLRRIDRGLYDFPVINRLTQKPTPPATRAVIDAVARRDHARLVVDGMTAANDLGLTTAVPAQVTVLTDARLKPLQLGAQQIRFRQAAPSRLYWAGRPAMRVVQALHWLHDVLPSDRNVVLRQLRQIVDDPDQGAAIAEDLRQGLSAMPIWMQSIVRDLVAGARHHGHEGGYGDAGDHHHLGADR